MRKKLISLILALVVVLGLCAGITSISVIAKADTEINVDDLFEATNTYDLKEKVKKEEPQSNESVNLKKKRNMKIRNIPLNLISPQKMKTQQQLLRM